MISGLVEKIKESASSVLPIIIIVVILNFTIAPVGTDELVKFLVGGFLIIAGLSIFLMGADVGMVPFGQKVGTALTKKRSLLLLLPCAFAIGFAITIAEPDVQVLASQVNKVNSSIDKIHLLLMIALGVGFFVMLGLLRTVLQLPLKYLLIFFYTVLFLGCVFVEPSFIGVAFDAGGATTGPITVPFIMALGIGVASATRQYQDDDSSFGLVGLASIGPIMAVAVMGFLSGEGSHGSDNADSLVLSFLNILPHVAFNISLALAPLLIFFILFQLTLLKLPAPQLRRMILGFIYVFIGLSLFMTGVEGGFSATGKALGQALGQFHNGWILIPMGLILGAVVVLAEPSVWILTAQVEEVSGGYIKRSIMLIALSISIALAVTLGMIRVVSSLSIWWFLVPGYALALGLTFFCPKLFTAIAFDSGGVASGPMSATFILSLTLGASQAVGGNPLTDAFGMIAMIAMAPLITIQILGLMVKIMEKRSQGGSSDNTL